MGHAGQGLLKTGAAVGLEQIIQGVELKGLDGVRVVGRRKHHLRQLLQLGQHLETRAARELNVQKHEVRPQGMNGPHGLGAVAGFPHEFIAGLLAHVLPQ